MVDIINENLSEFKDALTRRDLLEALGSLNYHLQSVVYPLHKLKKYFIDQQNSGLNQNDAEIFTFFVRAHLNDLRTIAKEINSEYASDI
jgi:hypothetical protein